MKMCNEVIAVLGLPIERRDRMTHARESADQELQQRCDAEKHRRGKSYTAPTIVALQLNSFTPVGTAISTLAATKNRSTARPRPTVNMWCAQTSRLKKTMITVEAATNSWPKIGLREKT